MFFSLLPRVEVAVMSQNAQPFKISRWQTTSYRILSISFIPLEYTLARPIQQWYGIQFDWIRVESICSNQEISEKMIKSDTKNVIIWFVCVCEIIVKRCKRAKIHSLFLEDAREYKLPNQRFCREYKKSHCNETSSSNVHFKRRTFCALCTAQAKKKRVYIGENHLSFSSWEMLINNNKLHWVRTHSLTLEMFIFKR